MSAESLYERDSDAAVILARLTKGYHEGGHHPNCSTRADEGCDCYARASADARAALARLAAHQCPAAAFYRHVRDEWIERYAAATSTREEAEASTDALETLYAYFLGHGLIERDVVPE